VPTRQRLSTLSRRMWGTERPLDARRSTRRWRDARPVPRLLHPIIGTEEHPTFRQTWAPLRDMTVIGDMSLRPGIPRISPDAGVYVQPIMTIGNRSAVQLFELVNLGTGHADPVDHHPSLGIGYPGQTERQHESNDQG
jgi:hypothetical protein